MAATAPPPADKISAAIEALNTFSNYCVITLADDNTRIYSVANETTRQRLWAEWQRIQEAMRVPINHQSEYLASLASRSRKDAEESLERSNPNMIIPRTVATNILVRFGNEIYNATLRR